MNWPWLFFSFRGRINRAKYWLALLVYVLIAVAFGLISWALSWLGMLPAELDDSILFRTLRACFDIAFSLSCLAVSAKRLHDRDKSGWWLLLLYVTPVAAVLLTWLFGAMDSVLGGMTACLCILAAFAFMVGLFVELGCLPGTRGYNRYGRNPVATV